MAKRLLVSAALIAVILTALTGCGNHPPEITGVIASPSSVQPGDTAVITCNATDADGDQLTYEWESVDEGGTTYTGASFNWSAPANTGGYRFYVTVTDGHGGVAYDSTLIVTVAFEGVSAPTLLQPSGAQVGTRTIELTWTSVEPSWVKYEIYRSLSPSARITGKLRESYIYPTHNRLDTTWIDQEGVYPGKTYYYVVVAYDSLGHDAASNEVVVTTTNFTNLGTEYFGGGNPTRLASKNNYIFCAARSFGVKGFTATNTGPNPGPEIAPLQQGDWAWDLFINSNDLDIAFGTGGWQHYDISNALNPVFLTAVTPTLPEARAVFSVGTDVFLGTHDPATSTHMLEWWDRNTYTLVDTILISNIPTDIYVSGNHVYVTMGNGGLDIISWSQASATLNRVRTYSTNGSANRVYISGSYAYLAVDGEGLLILDISTPSSPSQASQWQAEDGNDAQGIYFLGDFAYLADGNHGLRVLDIDKPWSPTYLYTMEIGGKIMDVWVRSAADKLQAILADWNDAIHMIEW